MNSRDSLILSLTGLVHSCVKKYRNISSPDYYDLVQEGMMGAIQAVDNYDPDKAALTTYAYYKITGRILDHIKANFGYMKILGQGGRKKPFSKIYFNQSLLPIDPTTKEREEFAKAIDVDPSLVEEFFSDVRYNIKENINQDDNSILLDKIDEVVHNKKTREISIFYSRLLGRTQAEVAKDYKVSTSYVNFVVQELKRELRSLFANEVTEE